VDRKKRIKGQGRARHKTLFLEVMCADHLPAHDLEAGLVHSRQDSCYTLLPLPTPTNQARELGPLGYNTFFSSL
jgi:hypothetical protein